MDEHGQQDRYSCGDNKYRGQSRKTSICALTLITKGVATDFGAIGRKGTMQQRPSVATNPMQS